MVWRRTAPSWPLTPAMLVPSTMLAGAIALPYALPAACAAMIVSLDSPCSCATLLCTPPKSTLDAVLLDVMKAPSAPMTLASLC